jgi:hypothetical protein
MMDGKTGGRHFELASNFDTCSANSAVVRVYEANNQELLAGK